MAFFKYEKPANAIRELRSFEVDGCEAFKQETSKVVETLASTLRDNFNNLEKYLKRFFDTKDKNGRVIELGLLKRFSPHGRKVWDGVQSIIAR